MRICCKGAEVYTIEDVSSQPVVADVLVELVDGTYVLANVEEIEVYV